MKSIDKFRTASCTPSGETDTGFPRGVFCSEQPTMELWERQHGESAKAFGAFSAYRDTPARDRSIPRCVAAYYEGESKAKVQLWQRWSSRWSWVKRADAWQDEQGRRARIAHLAEIEAMNRRHVEAAKALLAKALDALDALDADDLEPGQIRQFVVDAARLERTAMGEPDQVVEQRIRRPADEMTDDELAAIATGSG